MFGCKWKVNGSERTLLHCKRREKRHILLTKTHSRNTQCRQWTIIKTSFQIASMSNQQAITYIILWNITLKWNFFHINTLTSKKEKVVWLPNENREVVLYGFIAGDNSSLKFMIRRKVCFFNFMKFSMDATIFSKFSLKLFSPKNKCPSK